MTRIGRFVVLIVIVLTVSSGITYSLKGDKSIVAQHAESSEVFGHLPESGQQTGADEICGKRLAPDRTVLESYCLSQHLDEFWYVALLEEERIKPRAEQVIAGIKIGPRLVPRGGPCEGTPSSAPNTGPISEAQTSGTPLEVSPKFLPPGTEKLWTLAGECRGTLASVEVQLFVPADIPSGRFGGALNIFRFRGELEFGLDLPAERMAEGKIAGRPAVLVSPITDSGFGESAVVIQEDFGLTVIRATGVRLQELIQIGESLY
jgi:hypothetical protein